MCIICVSKQGAPQPTRQQLETMFTNNPDGFGYMYARDGRVHIHKGFMSCADMLRAVDAEKFTASDAVVYHFRISTQAGVTPTMTHPFAFTKNIELTKALDITCALGVAHNGVIRMTSTNDKEYNDTAIFITKYMTRLIHSVDDIKDSVILDMLDAMTNSKLALLDKSGYIALVGHFIEDANGLLFSNTSYIPRPVLPKYTYNYVNKFSFDDYDDDYTPYYYNPNCKK